MLNLKLVQAKPLIGNLEYNFALIKKYYQKALHEKIDICIFSELVTCGYLPQDLLLKPAFIQDLHQHLEALIPYVKETALLLPTPYNEDGILYNLVLAIQNGKIIGKTSKNHLPNYKIFDEKRYFTRGEPEIIIINGLKIGIPICEDIWFDDVCLKLKKMGAEFLIVPNASPYEVDKFNKRLSVVEARFQQTNLPIIYLNLVAAEDGIIFDGQSFYYDKNGFKPLLPAFSEGDINIEICNNLIVANPPSLPIISKKDEIYSAMVFSLREYVLNNNFNSVVIGLSGGIDSALVAAMAVDSLGSDKVLTIMMPSEFSGKQSMEDALKTVELLKVSHRIIPITDMLIATLSSIKNISDLAMQNLQSRIRGMILMSISNTENRLLITTGNKSELATGYATIYGDMCGAFNPVGDLYKTQLFKIAKWRNNNIPKAFATLNQSFPIMVENILTKPPSAELKFDQKDSDDLPEYEILDQILNLYLEQDMGLQEIIATGFDKVIATKIIKMVQLSEYKRNQAAPSVKLSSCNFSRERRYPITVSWHEKP